MNILELIEILGIIGGVAGALILILRWLEKKLNGGK